jgi:hypothetical protein
MRVGVGNAAVLELDDVAQAGLEVGIGHVRLVQAVDREQQHVLGGHRQAGDESILERFQVQVSFSPNVLAPLPGLALLPRPLLE